MILRDFLQAVKIQRKGKSIPNSIQSKLQSIQSNIDDKSNYKGQTGPFVMQT